MTFEWEVYREEICDLYLIQRRTLREVATFMRERHGFRASDRSYWNKIQEWGAQKHSPIRQARRTPHLSIDSGYQSQSVRCSWSTTASASRNSRNSTSTLGSLTTCDQQSSSSGQSSFADPHTGLSPSQHSVLPRLWSYPTHTNLIDTCAGAGDPREHFQPNFAAGTATLSEDPYVPSNYSLSFSPPSTSSKCVNHDSSLRGGLFFCAPHALPSTCWARDLDLTVPNVGLAPCHHCGASTLHHLASKARVFEVDLFESILKDHMSTIGQCDKDGNTCVHFAAGAGASLQQMDALACAGAPLFNTNKSGQTFLHVLNTELYCSNTLPAILRWAIRRDLEPRQRDKHGRTVWHSIFQRGIDHETFRALLPSIMANRADMLLLDEEHHTPLDCLKSYWQIIGDLRAIDHLHLRQSSGQLPVFHPLHQAETAAEAGSIADLNTDVSRLALGFASEVGEGNFVSNHVPLEVVSSSDLNNHLSLPRSGSQSSKPPNQRPRQTQTTSSPQWARGSPFCNLDFAIFES